MSTIPDRTLKTLQVLRQVAAKTLDKKRRLGHYAVIWRDGKAIALGDDAPQEADQSKMSSQG